MTSTEVQRSASKGLAAALLTGWPKDTITTEEIAQTGGWPVSDGVKQIDEDNVETDLKPGQVIEIKPGHGFAKKIRWKRG